MKPKGYTRTPTGFRAWVRVGKAPATFKSFPKGTVEKTIRDWREDERARLRAKARLRVREDAPTSAGFRADATVYLAAVKGMPSYHHRVREIAAWVREFGDRPRHGDGAISAVEIRTILNRWFAEEGPNVHVRRLTHGGKRPQTFSARSCNLHRTALSHLWNVLDGETVTDVRGRSRPIARDNPVRAVPKFRPPDADPRALEPGVPREIFSQMRESKTKARLLCIATTGIRHAQLMRLDPAQDWRRHDRVLFIRSGKHNKPKPVPLTREATEALTMMMKWSAWGRFSQPSAVKAFRRAIQKANVARVKRHRTAPCIPLTTTAYDLRHTFGTAVMRETKNIHAVKELLTHTSLALTERYLMAAVPETLRDAVRRLPRLTDLPETLQPKLQSANILKKTAKSRLASNQ